MFFVLVASVFVYGFFTNKFDPLFAKWFFYCLFSSLLTAKYFIAPRIGKTAAITFVYLFISAAYVWCLKENKYIKLSPYDRQALKLFAADSLLKLVIVITPLIALCKDRAKFMMWGKIAALAFCWMDCASVVGHLIFSPLHCSIHNSCYGILGNPSMNETVMVICLPLFYGWLRRDIFIFLCVTTLFTAIIAKTSIPIVLFAVMLALFSMDRLKALAWRLRLLSIVAIAVGWWWKGNFLDNSGRMAAWKFFMGNWNKNPGNRPFGMGFGTFKIFASNLQDAYKWGLEGGVTQGWEWLHNEFLELIFVCGYTGFALIISVYALSLWGFWCRKERSEATCLVLYGLGAAVNYPTHLAYSAGLGAWLLIGGLVKSEEEMNCQPHSLHYTLAVMTWEWLLGKTKLGSTFGTLELWIKKIYRRIVQ